MGAPKGSKNALGNKGGGRKSAYQERADARDADSMFYNEMNQEELERKIASGKFSIKDRLVLTAMEGDSIILSKVLQKVLPDKLKHQGDKDAPVYIQMVSAAIKKYGTGTDPSTGEHIQ